MRNSLLAMIAMVALSPLLAAVHAVPAESPTVAAPTDDRSLPAGEMQAKARLDKSPRHGEYVSIPIEGETTRLRAWVVYPEVKTKAGTVLVIHEIFGLSDWVRGVADQLAAEGFLAVVPDLISGMGPGGGGTDSVASRDDVVKLVVSLSPAETRKRLDVAREWATKQPSANGKFATVGFCWGGGRSFEYAASTPTPAGDVVYYGTTPDSATLLAVKAPVLGLYGGDDARVAATIPAAQKALGGKKGAYESHLFDGAGHGFLRQQDGKDGANLKAAKQAWPRTLAFLRERLK
jgi:carboxymethylenebutenolidase